MKKKVLLLAVMAICVAILATGTLAYFTHDDQVHNVITTNAVTIEIKEWQDNGGETLDPYPTDPVGIMPGTKLSKIAEIHNLDAQSWIRAKYDIVIYGADNEPMELSQETLDSLITIPVDGEKWLTKEDDAEWLYYADPVDDKTAPLFSEVSFSGPNMTNEYQGCRIEILVSAQAVQTANNGTTVLEATGWGSND